nr:vegetative cell wall protein gp1-like [Penaeus vannamei]
MTGCEPVTSLRKNFGSGCCPGPEGQEFLVPEVPLQEPVEQNTPGTKSLLLHILLPAYDPLLLAPRPFQGQGRSRVQVAPGGPKSLSLQHQISFLKISFLPCPDPQHEIPVPGFLPNPEIPWQHRNPSLSALDFLPRNPCPDFLPQKSLSLDPSSAPKSLPWISSSAPKSLSLISFLTSSSNPCPWISFLSTEIPVPGFLPQHRNPCPGFPSSAPKDFLPQHRNPCPWISFLSTEIPVLDFLPQHRNPCPGFPSSAPKSLSLDFLPQHRNPCPWISFLSTEIPVPGFPSSAPKSLSLDFLPQHRNPCPGFPSSAPKSLSLDFLPQHRNPCPWISFLSTETNFLLHRNPFPGFPSSAPKSPGFPSSGNPCPGFPSSAPKSCPWPSSAPKNFLPQHRNPCPWISFLSTEIFGPGFPSSAPKSLSLDFLPQHRNLWPWISFLSTEIPAPKSLSLDFLPQHQNSFLSTEIPVPDFLPQHRILSWISFLSTEIPVPGFPSSAPKSLALDFLPQHRNPCPWISFLSTEIPVPGFPSSAPKISFLSNESLPLDFLPQAPNSPIISLSLPRTPLRMATNKSVAWEAESGSVGRPAPVARELSAGHSEVNGAGKSPADSRCADGGGGGSRIRRKKAI